MQQRLTAATLIVALAGAVYAARITSVELVDISGDHTLTATKGTDGVVTLTTGVVKGFHLTEEASAGGYRLYRKLCGRSILAKAIQAHQWA